MGSHCGHFAAIIPLIALFGLAACSKPKAASTPPVEAVASELKLTNGHLFRIGHTNAFTGLMVEKYPDGKLKSRSSISNGVLSGLSEGWHTNGQVQVRERFRAGVSEGLRIKWETNGAKLSEAAIVGGKLNGPFRRWYPNGVLAEEVEMTDDNPNGLARAWYPSGSLNTEMRMASGKVVEQRRWTDGQVPPATAAQ